ncbi:hypothetical protein PBI_SCTP2_28 [Salicola phage SCTP-2]|nr:hypothetical protein PBI_SCTP2_28 [Salicola phage SCTP-2]
MKNLRYCEKHKLGVFSDKYMFLRTFIDNNVTEDEADKIIDQFLDDFDRYCEDYLPAIKKSVLRYCFRKNTYYSYDELLNDDNLTNGTDYGGMCLSYGSSSNHLRVGYATNNMILNDQTKNFHLEKIKEYTGYNVECVEYGDAYYD